MSGDPGKPTIDLLLATKAVVERDLAHGFITEQRLRFTIEARKRETKKLSEQGLSTREIAKVTGASQTQVVRDINGDRTKTVRNANQNGSPTTRELLSQSDQNDWRTPRKFLDAAREVMGAIDLDPASSAEANETVGAGLFYTMADDGLQQPWKGRVWLNPPYGGAARLFIERLIREYQVGNVSAACALINSHPTETKWFQELFDYPVCFIAGRIDFGGPSREISTTSTHGSAVCYLGNDPDKFTKAFSPFGSVVRKVK